MAAALHDAFREAEVTGEVVITDCGEFPCIACAGLGEPSANLDVTALHKDAARLSETRALSTYKDAGRVSVTFGAKDPGGLDRLILCQGYYPDPKDPKLDAAIKERLQERIVRLRHAF
ncbi:MAG: hypothetical protein QM765_35380 [Myxococcales bacterium]